MNPKRIVRKVVPKKTVRSLEKSYRKSRGVAWQARYGFPARGMKVIVVTGTNGKSTTCAYINEVLQAAGYKTAVLTTVFYEIAGEREPNKTHLTIDKQSIVQAFFAKARRAKVDWVVLEVTSHALHQDRIMGVPVEIAVVTNLTTEHLDYHKTMEEYARVKSLLVRNYKAKWAVLNADDEWYSYFVGRSTAQVFSFGKKSGSDALIQTVKLGSKSSEVELKTEAGKLLLKTSLLGEVNLYNAAAAASVGLVLGVRVKLIQKGVANLHGLAGRLEPIEAGQNFKVLVDFGVTPDAIEQVLTSLRQIAEGRVMIVFGATGDRDKAKRPIMGEVAANLADRIFLTDDETYTENPEVIRQAVYAGIQAAKGEGKTTIIPDRLEAIKAAFSEAKKGDIVLLTGIGHEDHRNMGGKPLPWDEREIARGLLKNSA